MKENILEIKLEADVEKDNLKKVLSFISKDIISIEILGDIIKIKISDSVDREKILQKYEKIMKKYISTVEREEVVFKQLRRYREYTTMDLLEKRGVIKKYGEGTIGFNGVAIKVFDFFSNAFKQIALEEGAEEKIYPTLLDIGAYKKTGYLKTFPQYSIFCCNTIEDIEYISRVEEKANSRRIRQYLNEPYFVLSPSACFHTYMEYQDTVILSNKVISFTQKVFRNEGRFNWDEIGRLRDYHIREIVLIGDEDFVYEKRKQIIEKTRKLLEQLKLDCCIVSASDMFILPEFQKYKELQVYQKSKYEVRLFIEEKQDIACASFNMHGISFSKPFNIQILGKDKVVTGCVGFGIDRWVLSFLAQYGINESKWPKRIQELFQQFNGRGVRK